MTRALDVSVCVVGGGGRGRQRPNYRGRTTRICVKKERPSYVLREIGWDREREREEREREGEG